MFVKLTKSDGSPVWMNPEFIVRIEAWKTGSAVAVAGDGDFEVLETPSSIIALAASNPPPATASAEGQAKPKTRGRRKKTEEPPAENPPAETPPAADAATAEPAPAPAPAEETPPAPAPAADAIFLDEPDEVSSVAAFLKKQRCRSRKRILNTIKNNNPKISMGEARSMLEQMEARGFVSIDAQGHAVFN